MKISDVRVGLLLTSAFMMLPAIANAADTTARTPARITLEASGISLPEAMKKVGDQAGVAIRVEPGLNSLVKANLTGEPLEKALTALTQANGAIWARVEVSGPKKDVNAMDGLFDLVRAMNILKASPISVQIGGSDDTITLTRQITLPALQTTSPVTVAHKTILYIIAGKDHPREDLSPVDPTDQAISLQQQRMDLLQSMAPEQQEKVLQSEYFYMMSLPVEARMQMALRQNEAFSHLSKEMQEQFMRSKKEMGERLKGIDPGKGVTQAKDQGPDKKPVE